MSVMPAEAGIQSSVSRRTWTKVFPGFPLPREWRTHHHDWQSNPL